MEFKGPYLRAMREQAPKMFVRLSKAGTLDAFAQQKSEEAHQLLENILADAEKEADGRPTMQARQEAEEIVRAQLIAFTDDEPVEVRRFGDGPRTEPTPAIGPAIWNAAKVIAVLVALSAAPLVVAEITRDKRPYNPAIFTAFREIEVSIGVEI
jgi:hypothetical protein